MDDSSPPTPELPERKNRLSSTSGIKRNKVSRACDECRKRKVRCDGAQPCARCQKSSTECIFSNVTPKRGPPKQYLEPFEARLKTIDTVLQVLELSSDNIKQQELTTTWEIKDPTIEANTHLDVDSIGHALYIPDYPARIDRITAESQNTKQLQTEPPQPELTIITTPTRPDLIQAYFDHIHPSTPFISRTIATQQSQPPSLLLNAMYAVASRFIPNNTNTATTNNDPPGWSYYKTAFGLIDTYSDVPRLTTVQALLLLAKYHEHIQRPGFFWRTKLFIQLAVNMSLSLGLSKEPNLHTEPSWKHEFETRRRTFWALYAYDVLMSTEQGSQTRFQHKECTVKYPHVLSDELNNDSNAVLDFYWLSKVIHTQAAVIQFMRLKYGDENVDENEQENFLGLEKDVMELGKCIPHKDSSLYASFTQLIYHSTTILLFRPFALSEESQSLYVSRCLSSASTITHIIDNQLKSQGLDSFYTVARGNQQIIYCLSAAVTIQKAFRNDSTNEIYEKTCSLIKMLLPKSPVTEIENTVQDTSHQQQLQAQAHYQQLQSALLQPQPQQQLQQQQMQQQQQIQQQQIQPQQIQPQQQQQQQWLDRSEIQITSPSNTSSTRSSPLMPNQSYPHSPNLPTPTVRKRHSRSSLQFTTSDDGYVLQSSSTYVPDMMTHRMRPTTNRSPYANNRLSAPALGSLYQQSHYYLQMQQQQQMQQQLQQHQHMSSYSQPSSPTTSQFSGSDYSNSNSNNNNNSAGSSFSVTPRRTTSLSRKTGLRRSASSTGEFVVPSQQRAANRGPYINPRRHTLTNSTPPDLSTNVITPPVIPPSPRHLHAMAVRNNRFSAPVMSSHTQLPYTIPITQQQQQYQQQSMMLDPSFPMDPVIPDSPNESMMGLLLNPWEFPH